MTTKEVKLTVEPATKVCRFKAIIKRGEGVGDGKDDHTGLLPPWFFVTFPDAKNNLKRYMNRMSTKQRQDLVRFLEETKDQGENFTYAAAEDGVASTTHAIIGHPSPTELVKTLGKTRNHLREYINKCRDAKVVSSWLMIIGGKGAAGPCASLLTTAFYGDPISVLAHHKREVEEILAEGKDHFRYLAMVVEDGDAGPGASVKLDLSMDEWKEFCKA